MIQHAQEGHGHGNAVGVKEQAAMNERLFHMVLRGHSDERAAKNRACQRRIRTHRRFSSAVAILKASAFQAHVATKALVAFNDDQFDVWARRSGYVTSISAPALHQELRGTLPRVPEQAVDLPGGQMMLSANNVNA
eukprot:3595547-Pyramimonas_sp.AAC.1